MRVLILGGTAEARQLAAELAGRPGIETISSLAGRVREPRLPVGEVRIGGFGGAEGLARWLVEHPVDAVIDATHPYAERIRASSVRAAAATGLPHLRLARPGWTAQPGDRWQRVPDFAAAAAALAGIRRVFVTTGRQRLAEFIQLPDAWLLVRVVDDPDEPLPPHVHLIRDRGPFTVDSETELLTAHRIQAVVTKDSGGDYTAAKLVAARTLGLPVVMIDRPPAVRSPAVAATVAAALSWLDWLSPDSRAGSRPRLSRRPAG